jgi:hypothetical protein
VARAIEQLVENLNRPVGHRDALLWRLRGPVGPRALAQALDKAAQSPGEASFLLSEVVLALRRVKAEKIAVGVPADEVSRELEVARDEIAEMARTRLRQGGVPEGMGQYVTQVLVAAACQ